MEGSVSPKCNKLLEMLSDQTYAHVQPHLELGHLPAGVILQDTGQMLRHAVFPVSGLVGRVAMTADGKSTELTISGREGMIGLSILLGGRPLGSRAVVLTNTTVYKLPSAVMLSAWRHSEPFQTVMLRYVHAMIQEVIQVALCNKHHTVEQQLSRWLLMASHRLGEPRMHVTQAFISQMLGVRREGVTEAAGKLEAHGALTRERGGMTVIDPDALQRRGCECYAAIIGHHERMVADIREDMLESEGKRSAK